jgi:glycosyltransferase involved in cell wall biosynthesis
MPAQVIHNGIDWRRYAELASRPMRGSHIGSEPIVAWVGRVHATKRPRLFLQIAAELSAQLPDAQFRMVASVGPYTRADDVEAITAMGRAYPRFAFLPGITPSSMPFFYALVRASGGLLMLTSLDEPFGLVTVEAMASGIPVIASNSGSAPEIIDDGLDGILLPEPYSVASACETAAALLRDSGRYATIAARAQAKVARRFSLEAMTQAYVDLYARLGHWPEMQSGSRAHLHSWDPG